MRTTLKSATSVRLPAFVPRPETLSGSSRFSDPGRLRKVIRPQPHLQVEPVRLEDTPEPDDVWPVPLLVLDDEHDSRRFAGLEGVPERLPDRVLPSAGKFHLDGVRLSHDVHSPVGNPVFHLPAQRGRDPLLIPALRPAFGFGSDRQGEQQSDEKRLHGPEVARPRAGWKLELFA